MHSKCYKVLFTLFLINYKHSEVIYNSMYVYVYAFEQYYRHKTLHPHFKKIHRLIIFIKKTTLRKIEITHLYNVIITNKDIGTSQISV